MHLHKYIKHAYITKFIEKWSIRFAEKYDSRLRTSKLSHYDKKLIGKNTTFIVL